MAKEQQQITGRVSISEPQDFSEPGMGTHTVQRFFQFLPDDPIPQRMPSFRSRGIGQQMPDGSFHFVPTPRKKSSSITLKKLPHGKLSETADGAIQLTLKIYKTETGNLYKKLLDEAKEALK